MTWTGPHRRETGLLEHHCEHGIGHPNAGSAMRMAFDPKCQRSEDGVLPPAPAEMQQLRDDYASWMVHGCDGCCGFDDFPGSPANTLLFSIEKYELEQLAELAVRWPFIGYALMAFHAE